MVLGFLKRILGDPNRRTIGRLQKVVQEINAMESQFQAFDDEQLRAQTALFRKRLDDGETLTDLLPEAFAATREASRRTIGLRHYDVQLIGGMILHDGKVAEMRTGEGKTLVATLPLYLNALLGRGAHLVTPNDYLAKYGVQWMGPIYHALGVSVSVIQSGAGHPDQASFLYDPNYASDDDRYQYLRPITRKEAYRADITYGTNNEFGFDYLRDNMIFEADRSAHRDLYYAIIDEVDSILIDEARTPLIISGPADKPSDDYQRFAQLAPRLRRDEDYEVDERTQTAILTEDGVAKIEGWLEIPEGESIYDPTHAYVLPYLDNALRAKEFFQRDKRYVVREGEIVIVDEFTGRLMFGRRYSEGLHQAIEAKENVEIQRESLTYATIAFQNFFRMYEKIAGMTGTAATEEEELHKIYGLDVVILPTNVEYRTEFGDLDEYEVSPDESGVTFGGVLNGTKYPVTIYDGPNERYYRRLDLPDQIYKTEKAKFNAVVKEIQQAYEAGRPVLVGTTAIETSERLARLLNRRRIPHNVLNAKQHEREAIIIAQAGQPGAVTIATNMAGRGVDILLGGNPEGMARDALRRESEDLTQIPSAAWDDALKMARRGEDPTTQYPERWAEVLFEKVQQCAAERAAVYKQGGLHVIGTERHEARRIDNQLRGRAGRQGDPGSSRFYISLEDELMRRFGGDRIEPWMERAGFEDAPLEFNVLNKLIESIQERVEGYNFDVRKHLLEYDDVATKQRTIVYKERNKILHRTDLHDDLMDMVSAEIQRVVESHTHIETGAIDHTSLLAELRMFIPIPRAFNVAALEALEADAIMEKCETWAEEMYWKMYQSLGERAYQYLRQGEFTLQVMETTRDPFQNMVVKSLRREMGDTLVEEHYEHPLRRLSTQEEKAAREIIAETYRRFRDRQLMLEQLDDHWVRHLTSLDMLREGIGLRAVGQQNPLVAYQREAFEMYGEMMGEVQQNIVRKLFHVPQQQETPARRRRPQLQPQHAQLRMQQAALRASAGDAQQSAPEPYQKRTNKPGRNDPCWCGSGRKYKQCHWHEDKRQPAR